MTKINRQEIIDNFFTCNKEELLEIIREFLSTLEAEETIPPGELMTRNYETAQSNPEIHALPGNLRDARDTIFPFFWGTDGWNSKLHLENVKGPANYASFIGALACLLKNPNLCVDTYSQRSNELEVKAITSLANLVFYNTHSPWGIFTMGGTISNLYGGRIGIEKVVPHAMEKGLQGQHLVGIVSEAAHYSNQTVAGWLGMGTENLHAIATDEHCAMRLDLLEQKIEELYREKHIIAFVIATFGTTDAFGIDDIKGIRNIIDERALAHNMPKPQLHVDGAAGWTMCMLDEYDIEKNCLEASEAVLQKIAGLKQKSLALQVADSITVDFHKMGWGHYPSSAFIVNHRQDLTLLTRQKSQMPYFCEAEYRHDPALFTLECSRPALGPYIVMASLNGIGLLGYQALIIHSLEMAVLAREKLNALKYCKVLCPESLGPSVVWWALPKGRNAEEIYHALINGKLSQEKYQQYCKEIAHKFEKRKKDMNPGKDARLSYTMSIGYKPDGLTIPAWKAVFFNPKTDSSVVERVIESIQNL